MNITNIMLILAKLIIANTSVFIFFFFDIPMSCNNTEKSMGAFDVKGEHRSYALNRFNHPHSLPHHRSTKTISGQAHTCSCTTILYRLKTPSAVLRATAALACLTRTLSTQTTHPHSHACHRSQSCGIGSNVRLDVSTLGHNNAFGCDGTRF